MDRNSRGYRILMSLLTLAVLGGAGYFAWTMFKPKRAADTLAEGEDAYKRGVTALEAKDGPGATAAFDDALARSEEVLKKLTELQSAGKLKQEETGTLEGGRGGALWLKARAIRDRAFAKSLAAGKPLTNTLDTTTQESYRSFARIPDDQERKEALTALQQAATRLPKNPDIHKEWFRVLLGIEPTNWPLVAQQSRVALDINPKDVRAHYLLARVEFEQFDEKGQPTKPDKRDPQRVLKARQHLEESKKAETYPYWRTADLDVQIGRWLVAQPADKRPGIDPAREAARIREILFEPKAGALARAAAREGFEAMSRFDVAALMNLHRAAVEVLAEDTRTDPAGAKGRLAAALASTTAAAKAAAELPRLAPLTDDLVAGLTEVAHSAQATWPTVGPEARERFVRDVDAVCRSAASKQLCPPEAAARLAGVYLTLAAGGEPPAVAAAEKRAMEWYEEAAKSPKASTDLRNEAHTWALELQAATGADPAAAAPHLAALREAKSSRATAAAGLFAAVFAERAGRLEEAFRHLAEAAGTSTDGGEYSIRAFAALPAVAVALGNYADAANYARELDRGWDSLATLNRYGKTWADRHIASRDELAALAAVAQYGQARQRVEREQRGKPAGPAAPADLTRTFEKAGALALQKLKGKGGPNLVARLAHLEFLTAARRTADAQAAAQTLYADYPDSPDVLRAEFPTSNVEARKAADPRARKAGGLFWAEWLASTGRTTEAIAEVEKAPAGKGLAALLKGANPKDVHAAQAGLIRAIASADASNVLTFERSAHVAVRTAIERFANGKFDEAARGFRSASEVVATKAAAVEGLRQSLAALSAADPDKARRLTEELK
jgi:hypothetical protein